LKEVTSKRKRERGNKRAEGKEIETRKKRREAKREIREK
jgi:hypothetical protein